MFSPAHFAADEPGRLQHADMTGDTGECHGQWRSQIGDAGIAIAQRLQQPAPGGIGERGVRAVQHLIFNHIVDYSGGPWLSEDGYSTNLLKVWEGHR